jgi:hypothetical protein
MRVRVFLRQSLFSMKGEHLPAAAVILDGDLVEVNALGVRVRVSKWSDEKGRELEGEARDLLIPEAKLDHIAYVS